MGDLRLFPLVSELNHEPGVMLELAKRGDLKEVVILGKDKDGGFFFSASHADGGGVLWLLELAKHELIKLSAPEL